MNLVSKYGYIDKLDDMMNKYNNTYHSTIKMKPLEVSSGPYIGFDIENNVKIRHLKIMILEQYQKMKTFLQKVTFQTSVTKFL